MTFLWLGRCGGEKNTEDAFLGTTVDENCEGEVAYNEDSKNKKDILLEDVFFGEVSSRIELL